ncbi:hypothetical protein FQN57_006016 [Myotisia sp. PD_48]|nr:hypothetical protein FQN57_006016 [Myotisia sp. PD_48]
MDEYGQFWGQFHKALKAANPDCHRPPTRGEEQPPPIDYKPDLVKNITLPDRIILPDGDKRKLRKAHAAFLASLSGGNAPKPPYKLGTKGMVSTVGGDKLPVFITSLYMLRWTGSQLPVELFVANDAEYDPYICETLLPSLNARCIILQHILRFSPLEEGLKGYQFKIFSLLFSSFEDVLFFDADAFPMRDPAPLFTSEPFASSGLVTWPDFWQVTYHPAFFEVTSQPLPTAFDHPSTESGQLLISKRSHSKLLLLSTYYNFYGPEIYYPLLSQGYPGEGDKETFIAPAKILNLPFYAVSAGPSVIGYTQNDGQWKGGVMLQADPSWDANPSNKDRYGWTGKPRTPPDGMFSFHANIPKLEPVSVFGENGLVWTADGKPKRMWGPTQDLVNIVGYDIEKTVWKACEQTACELEGNFLYWDDKPRLCDKIRRFIQDMSSS